MRLCIGQTGGHRLETGLVILKGGVLMALTSAMEDYLEAVLMMQQRHGYVRCVDVAEQLGVKKPSVSGQSRNSQNPAIL